MVEAKTKAPRTGVLKVQVEDIDRRIVSISQVVEAIQIDIEEVKTGIQSLQSLRDEIQGLKEDAPKEAGDDMVVVIERLGTTEEKVAVIEQYVKTFNVFLNSSMISNNTDKSAEDALTEVLDQLPA